MLRYLRFPKVFWFLIPFQAINTIWAFARYFENGRGLTLGVAIFGLASFIFVVVMGRQAQASQDRIDEINREARARYGSDWPY